MKKLIATMTCAVLAAAVLAGCGGSSSSSTSSSSSSAASQAASTPASSAASSEASSAAASSDGYNLDDIVSAIEAANPISNPLELDETALEFDMMLTMENVEEFAGVRSNDQGNSGTILVVKAAAGKAGDVSGELETYKQNQVAYYGNYAEFADGQAQIEEGRVVTSGDYVVLVFANTEGADYGEIDKAIDSALN